jgi:hypothetical protein
VEYLDLIEQALEQAALLAKEIVWAVLLWSRLNHSPESRSAERSGRSIPRTEPSAGSTLDVHKAVAHKQRLTVAMYGSASVKLLPIRPPESQEPKLADPT